MSAGASDASNDPDSRSMEGRVLFLAGGPGLSVAYAADEIDLGATRATWTFFEQPGCGAERTEQAVTTEATVAAAIAALERLSAKPAAVVAHSWGAYVALEVLKAKPAAVASVTLLNPVPATRAGFDEAVAALFARIAPDTLATIQALLAKGDAASGREIMHLALPAYCGRVIDLPSLRFDLSIPTYRSVLATLGAYDHRRLLTENRDRITLVFGAQDYITPALYEHHLGQDLGGFRCERLQGGHFSFLEDTRAQDVLLTAAFA